jgi:hypothetical protein
VLTSPMRYITRTKDLKLRIWYVLQIIIPNYSQYNFLNSFFVIYVFHFINSISDFYAVLILFFFYSE